MKKHSLLFCATDLHLCYKKIHNWPVPGDMFWQYTAIEMDSVVQFKKIYPPAAVNAQICHKTAIYSVSVMFAKS